MKSRPIIMQDFSIAGIKKQWDYDQKCGKILSGFPDASSELPTETIFHYGSKSIVSVSKIGCKTETRRLTGLKEINKNPDLYVLDKIGQPFWAEAAGIEKPGVYANFIGKGLYEIKYDEATWKELYRFPHIESIRCPYGVPGDELWVREAFAYTQFAFAGTGTERGLEDSIIFKADDTAKEWDGKWQSPMFMPREASRITLLIESVTVERLHDISEESAIREGILPLEEGLGRLGYWDKWKEMHGEESWNLNPWVWVIGFSLKTANNETKRSN